MPFNSKFSAEVYHARDAKGFTQKQVAEAVSISVRWYQRVEKGEKLPSALTMLRLILFLELNVEEFREEAGLLVSLPSN